jgi:DNA-binding response OmpR family regulator
MGKKILIIDDDTDVLDIMEEIFNYEGFAVLTSPVADDYESIIRRNDIDLVIIDYLLQGVNGGEICNQIKCSSEFGHLPVIIYSAYPKVSQMPGRYSYDAFIAKPFDLTDIVAQVTRLLYRPANYLLTSQQQINI